MRKIYSIFILLFSCAFSFSQSWTNKADVPVDLAFPVVVELNGNIHVIGGGGPSGATDIHLRYTPATDTWDTLAPVPYLSQQPAGAVVNGKIHYCGGGYPTSGQRLDLHYYYDPDSNAWYQAASLPVAVAIHKCVELEGKLYVLSGQPDKALCESYDPITDSWTQLNPLPDQDFWYGVIVNANNSIYRFGGGAYFSPSDQAQQYDVLNDSWINLNSLPMQLHGSAGAGVGDSLIWIIGGYSGGNDLKEVWIYNINDQTYTLTDSLPLERSYHAAVNAGGCIYSVGGNHNGAPQVGTELLQNCTPNITSVLKTKNREVKPYSIVTSHSDFYLSLNSIAIQKSPVVKLIDMQGRILLTKSIGGDGRINFGSDEVEQGKYIVEIVIDQKRFLEEWMVSKFLR
jgi:N-acetylneuraminic acid mutarotase